MARKWFEVTEDGGVHALTGVPLRKGDKHFIEEGLVKKSKYFKETQPPAREEPRRYGKPKSGPEAGDPKAGKKEV